MADATGTTTTNYAFKTLASTDTAGYTSINSIVTSIDTKLLDKVNVAKLTLIYRGTVAPSGWAIVTSASIYASGAPTLNSGYVYIEKSA